MHALAQGRVMTGATLAISIVTFAPDVAMLTHTVVSLAEALSVARGEQELEECELILVDNGPGAEWEAVLRHLLDEMATRFDFLRCRLLSGHGNVGYGQGHNLAAECVRAGFHLVLNPDVVMSSDSLVQALRFMRQHHDVGMLTPASEDEKGDRHYLCKRYPTILDLSLRAWAPRFVKNWFAGRLAHYEMRDCYCEDGSDFETILASGCFMLCRRTAWDAVGGFSENYFMYFEDFDLSMRMRQCTRIVCVPSVRIAHAGGGAGKKGLRHVLMFVKSAAIFFRSHGWRLA